MAARPVFAYGTRVVSDGLAVAVEFGCRAVGEEMAVGVVGVDFRLAIAPPIPTPPPTPAATMRVIATDNKMMNVFGFRTRVLRCSAGIGGGIGGCGLS